MSGALRRDRAQVASPAGVTVRSRMKAVVVGLAVLFLAPALVHAGLSTDGVVQCWNQQEDAISVSCNISQRSNGGAEGYCIVSTYRGGWKGSRSDWLLEGRVEPIGGSHSIVTKEKSLF